VVAAGTAAGSAGQQAATQAVVVGANAELALRPNHPKSCVTARGREDAAPAPGSRRQAALVAGQPLARAVSPSTKKAGGEKAQLIQRRARAMRPRPTSNPHRKSCSALPTVLASEHWIRLPPLHASGRHHLCSAPVPRSLQWPPDAYLDSQFWHGERVNRGLTLALLLADDQPHVRGWFRTLAHLLSESATAKESRPMASLSLLGYLLR
jgi:hypothetical protein